MKKGCSTCIYAGHVELMECPDAYKEHAKYCNNYNHEDFDETDIKKNDEKNTAADLKF